MLFSSVRTASRSALQSTRSLSTATSQTKVTILGAGGGIGQPLSLLLKLNPEVTNLALYDIRGAPGVAADVGHCDFASRVDGYAADKLDEALDGSRVIIIPAGVPRKPGMTRDDLFNTNASIVRDLATAIARTAPDAHILVISNPVNSTVPIVAETLAAQSVFNPKKLFGVTTLDVVRAAKFLSQVQKGEPNDSRVTVVGGHSGNTIVPLLSQTKGTESLTDEVRDALIKRIQFGGDEVVQAKDGAGSATLSMAYAGATFASQLIRALNGEKGITVPTFVKSDLFADKGVDFFASNVELGTNGVERIHGLGKLSAREEELLSVALPELKTNIEKGKAFVA